MRMSFGVCRPASNIHTFVASTSFFLAAASAQTSFLLPLSLPGIHLSSLKYSQTAQILFADDDAAPEVPNHQRRISNLADQTLHDLHLSNTSKQKRTKQNKKNHPKPLKTRAIKVFVMATPSTASSPLTRRKVVRFWALPACSQFSFWAQFQKAKSR
jgi:hypothetical protein